MRCKMKHPSKTILFLLFFSYLLITLGVSAVCAEAQLITTLTIKEKVGATTSNYPLTFAHVFKKGGVPNSVTIVADGAQLDTQCDIKKRYDDNSIRHAIISVILPQVNANQSLTLQLFTSDETANQNEMNKNEILSTDVGSKIELTNISGSGYSGSLTADLRSSIQNMDQMNYWLKGSVCTEILVVEKLNNSLNAAWEARFYPGTSYGVRISNSIENIEADYRGNIDYAVSINLGNASPIEVYSKPKFQHNISSRWRKVLWVGNKPPEVEIRYDTNYLISTGHIMNYDTSLNVPESVIASSYSNWQSSDHDIMGTGYIQTKIGTAGGREDIAVLPTWCVRYLLTMDNRMREVMLNHAEMASSAPMHYRESDNNRAFYSHVISINDRPTTFLFEHLCDNYSAINSSDLLPKEIGETSTNWAIDNETLSHQPDFAYLPYLITGEYYYLQELYYWAGFDLAARHAEYRQGDKGIITHTNTRGFAWPFRTLSFAASIAPDEHPENQYFNQKVDNNINYYTTRSSLFPLRMWDEDTTIDGLTSDIGRACSPWMEDYMLLCLTTVKELGFSAGQIIDWYKDFFINRFTHPDFNPYKGCPYRFPVRYTNGNLLQTWSQANAAIPGDPSSFPADDYPYSYRYLAMAALSCLTEYPNGQKAYDFLKANVNSQEKLNEDPTWAIIPRNIQNQEENPTISAPTGLKIIN